MRLLGVPGERQKRPLRVGTPIKKNRQYLAKLAGTWYCFSENSDKPARRFPWTMRDLGFGVKNRE
jgi:hypothetical protein